MILYLASYPRSGNSWLISIAANMLGVLPVDIHVSYDTPIRIDDYSASTLKWYGIQVESFPASRSLEEEALRPFLITYRRGSSPFSRVGLRPGGLESLVQRSDIREALAADQEVHVLKTHFLPYETYFPGEKVLQIVRHPGASIWSYHVFLSQYPQLSCSLEDVLAGNVPFGGWSDYHQSWLHAADSLGDRYLCISYESLFGQEAEYGRRIGDWLGLPAVGEGVPSFSYFHSLNGDLVRKGDPDNWKLHFSEEQLARLFEIHGKTMGRLGYS